MQTGFARQSHFARTRHLPRERQRRPAMWRVFSEEVMRLRQNAKSGRREKMCRRQTARRFFCHRQLEQATVSHIDEIGVEADVWFFDVGIGKVIRAHGVEAGQNKWAPTAQLRLRNSAKDDKQK
jgi:hypothetical protein